MPKVRPITPEQAGYRIGSGWGDSKAKAGVWFAEKAKFKSNQKKVLAALKEQVDFLGLEGAIMVVNQKTPGIVLVAPNPSLPGIIVLSNGVTEAGTARLQKAMEAAIGKIVEDLGIEPGTKAKR
jgi:hypothetical protein